MALADLAIQSDLILVSGQASAVYPIASQVGTTACFLDRAHVQERQRGGRTEHVVDTLGQESMSACRTSSPSLRRPLPPRLSRIVSETLAYY